MQRDLSSIDEPLHTPSRGKGALDHPDALDQATATGGMLKKGHDGNIVGATRESSISSSRSGSKKKRGRWRNDGRMKSRTRHRGGMIVA